MDVETRLRFLVPILEDSLTVEEIESVYHILCEKRIISSDVKRDYQKEKTASFVLYVVNALSKTKRKWVSPFCEAVSKTSKEYNVGKVVRFFLVGSLETMEELMWLFKNWKNLKHIENILQGCDILSSLKSNPDKVKQLLGIANYFKKFYDNPKKIMLHKFIKTKLEEVNNQEKNISDIQVLKHFKSFLIYNITSSTLNGIAGHMKLQNSFSKNGFKKLKSIEEFPKKLDHFFLNLENLNNQLEWKNAFLDALNKEKMDELHELLTSWFKKQKPWLWWIVENADIILQKEMTIKTKLPDLNSYLTRYNGMRWLQPFILMIDSLNEIKRKIVLENIENIIGALDTSNRETKDTAENEPSTPTKQVKHDADKREQYEHQRTSQNIQILPKSKESSLQQKNSTDLGVSKEQCQVPNKKQVVEQRLSKPLTPKKQVAHDADKMEQYELQNTFYNIPNEPLTSTKQVEHDADIRDPYELRSTSNNTQTAPKTKQKTNQQKNSKVVDMEQGEVHNKKQEFGQQSNEILTSTKKVPHNADKQGTHIFRSTSQVVQTAPNTKLKSNLQKNSTAVDWEQHQEHKKRKVCNQPASHFPAKFFHENETGNSQESPLSLTKIGTRVDFYLLVEDYICFSKTVNVYINADFFAGQLNFNKKKNYYEGSYFVINPTTIKYKYHYSNGSQQIWENLPGSLENNRIFEFTDDNNVVKIFDICSFSKYMIKLHEVNSMYGRNLSKFLPHMNSLDFKSNPNTIIMFLSHIEDLWLYYSKPLRLEEAPNFVPSLQPSMRSLLFNYVRNSKPNQNSVNQLLVMTVIMVLDTKHNIDFKKNQNWSKTLSNILTLTTSDKADLEVLYSNMTNLFKKYRLQDVLKRIVEMLPFVLHRIFLLPLVFFLLNKGSITYNSEIWNKSKEILNLDGKIETKKEWKLMEKMPIFRNLIPTCSQIIVFYQSLLNAFDMMVLLEKDPSLMLFFKVNIFMDALHKSEFYDLMKFTGSAKTTEWVLTTLRFMNSENSNTNIGTKKFAVKLYHTSTDIVKKTLINPIFVETTKWILSVFFLVLQFHKKHVGSNDDLSWLIKLLQKTNFQNNSKNNQGYKTRIQFWNFLMDLDIEGENINFNFWISNIKQITKNYFLNVINEVDEFVKYINTIDIWEANRDVQSCFYDAAYECLLNKSDQKETSFYQYLNPLNYFKSKNSNVVKMFEKLFDKQWKLCDNDIIQFIHWPFLVHFYELFDDAAAQKSLLQCTLDLMQSVKIKLEKILNHLKFGDITLLQLQKIVEAPDVFLDSLKIFEKKNNTILENVRTLVDVKITELKKFNKIKTNSEYFFKLCQNTCLTEDTRIDHINKLQLLLNQDISEMKWSSLFSSVVQNPKENVFLTSDPYVQKSLAEIQRYQVKDTPLLLFMWKNLINLPKIDTTKDDDAKNSDFEHDTTPPTVLMKQIIDSVWLPLKEKVYEYKDCIKTGSVSFNELEEMLLYETFNELNCTEIFDLIYSFDDEKNLEQNAEELEQSLLNKQIRNQQMLGFFQIKNYITDINVIHILIEVLSLKENFSFLDIYEMSNEELHTMPIAKMPIDVVKICDEMNNFGENDFKTLEHFLKQRELIKWLKNNMKDRGEVKVLSDLAMISAGESTLEVDKVSCFVSSVNGFAPLLFDLQKNATFSDIIKAIKAVMDNKEQDARFDKKWETTGQYLGWLEEIKNMHGSVEESSLQIAQDIICRGMFQIGGEEANKPSLSNSLHLKIRAKEEQNNDKQMSVEKLHELRSRLMLIAGEAQKGSENVKKFIDILAAVENLTLAYVQLKSSGCLLFNNWKATLICESSDSESKENLNLFINFDKESRSIVCGDDVMNEIKLLTGVFRKVHTKWNHSLNEKREMFYELNNFGIKQIIYLCKNLANVDSKKPLPDQVYTLLSCIKIDVSHDDIVESLSEATNKKNDVDMTNEELKEEPEKIEKAPIEKKRELFDSLCKEFDDEIIIKAAVQDIGENDDKFEYENRYLWVMERVYDEEFEDEKKKLAEQFDNEIGIQLNEVAVLDAIVKDQSPLTLQKVVEMILKDDNLSANRPSVAVKTACTRYIEQTSVTSLSDCISLEHLGIFLQHLSTKSQKKLVLRDFPETLNIGMPNLIVCPKGGLISYLLALYENSKDQPLPTTSEVLICTLTTTQEEIELFLRRAVGKSKGRLIFSLGAAEKLSYELSEFVDSFLKKLESTQNNCNPNYCLVILTEASEHYISQFFNEQRVEYKINADNQLLKDYVSSQMTCEQNQLSPAAIMKEGRLIELVLSERAGLGKSLYISRLKDRVSNGCHVTTIRFLEKRLNVDEVLSTLVCAKNFKNNSPHFIHFDVTPSVSEGLYTFFLNLLVLGSVEDSLGMVWRRNQNHVYVIEYTFSQNNAIEGRFLDLLPQVQCLSPLEIIDKGICDPNDVTMDVIKFRDEMFQRPYQYLMRYKRHENLDGFIFQGSNGTPKDCIQTLLNVFNLRNPTWSELRHFSSFLNCQLRDCEESLFCNLATVGQDSGLSGFKNFVVKFMIEMSQEFATPSLLKNNNKSINDVLKNHQLEKKWEESTHPYLFFNNDRVSMSFINFRVNSTGIMIHPKTLQQMDSAAIMSTTLYKGLKLQNVNLNQDYGKLSRRDKMQTLIKVLGVENVGEEFDPDPSYELTTDNVLKILAIQMRFRCEIPVIIMGETGCGKTRMVEFMSKLKLGNHQNLKNMIIVKVHGGTTVQNIQSHVKNAAGLARENYRRKPKVETLLFLDEANTTEAIYAIKEFVCDGTVDGVNMQAPGLCIIAACNPYRKHDEDTIKKMEESGLGFRVRTKDTSDKLGTIPMRCLVYRVIALPPSMQPLVWDFGQLNSDAENAYIRQMVDHIKLGNNVKLGNNNVGLVVDILASSQEFMRRHRSQCRFVSLRDVERCLTCLDWFYKNSNWLFEERKEEKNPIDRLTWSLLLAIGMCYHVTLEERKEYLEEVSKCLNRHGIHMTQSDISYEITFCQQKFLQEIELDKEIACNEALRENAFMMIMCAELKIPLFVIGKPGSSKSLAKTVVTDSMQGQSSKTEFFRHLKEIHVLSFQCSAVADAVGIKAVFNQCATLQSKRDLSKFVAVVVLDEIGLAEDSPKMPLKVLHPLLESGVNEEELLAKNSVSDNESLSDSGDCQQDNQKNKGFGKVGFVGISNWALDPAKLNRGIFMQRGSPTESDLELTAQGIFKSTNKEYEKNVNKIVTAITRSYTKLYQSQDQEFFGLRDYYGLLKMIFYVVSKDERNIEFLDVVNAILRNFSGGKTDCIKIFMKDLKELWPKLTKPRLTLEKMIIDNLQSVNTLESRFLLLLTNQYAAAHLLTQVIDTSKFQFIFGSSFPQDNNYTEVCKNINRIKICMETGCTVVLLNLRDLYESLYDALNQHYLTFAGQRYVDLGLGGHRVKCRISNSFRLIVIEDKNVVYNEFPIPLINRLEKHIFTTENVLHQNQLTLKENLEIWVEDFAQANNFLLTDVFIGFSTDSIASAILSASHEVGENDVNVSSKFKLLRTSTIDSVFRLEKSLTKEAGRLRKEYFSKQEHDHLYFLMKNILGSDNPTLHQIEITSFSKMLSESEKNKLALSLGLESTFIRLLTLQQYKTENDFSAKVKLFFENTLKHQNDKFARILLIQCAQAESNQSLIACSKYSVKNIIQSEDFKELTHHIVVAFVFTTERNCGGLVKDSDKVKGLISMSSPDCASIFVDELRVGVDYIGPPSRMWFKKISEVIKISIDNKENQQERDNSNFTQAGFLLDINKLVEACLPVAVLKLNDPKQHDATSQRLKALFGILKEGRICKHFLTIICGHIYTVTKARDETIPENDWAIREACNQRALNEAGTFTKTLWLKIKEKTSTVLAKILSFIDEDENLLILCSNNLEYANLWLEMFNNTELFLLTWTGTESKFDVKNLHGAKFPFSRRIIEFFNKHWMLPDLKKDLFVSRLQKTKVYQITATTNLKIKDVVKRFTNDLVYLHFCKQLEQCGLEAVVCSLLSIFYCQRKIKREKGDNFDENALTTMFIIFKQEYILIQHFCSLALIAPEVLTKENINSWKLLQNDAENFILHTLYFENILDNTSFPLTTKDAGQSIANVTVFSKWTQKFKKIKIIANSILKESTDDKLNLKWRSLLFAELFLNQLIPDSLDKKLFKGYLQVLSPLACRLYAGSKMKGGMNTTQFFNIVRKNISLCIKEIFLRLLLGWKKINCMQCKNSIKDPVVFRCQHFSCKHCIDLHIKSQKRNCPVCHVDFEDDFDLAPSALSLEQSVEWKAFKSNCTSFFLDYLFNICFSETNLSSKNINAVVKDVLQELVIGKNNKNQSVSSKATIFDETPTIRSFILQVLMENFSIEVELVFEEHFTKAINKRELMAIFVKSKEDTIWKNMGRNLSILDFKRELVNLIKRYVENIESGGFVGQLYFVAHLKVAVKLVLSDIKQDAFDLEFAREIFCTDDNNLLKEYLVKLTCLEIGGEAYSNLVEDKSLNFLVPDLLVQSLNDSLFSKNMSTFTAASGNDYVAMSDLLLNYDAINFPVTAEKLKTVALKSKDSFVQVLLSFYNWFKVDTEIDVEKHNLYTTLVDNLEKPEQNFVLLETKLIPICTTLKGTSWMIENIKDLFVTTILTIKFGSPNNLLMNELKILLDQPQLIPSLFLATVPQSCYFDVIKIVKLFKERYGRPPKSYLCPNKHPYFVGDCTNVIEGDVKCPDCGEPIGGITEGVLKPGNTAGEITEASYKGYLLAPPTKRPNYAVPERDINKLDVSIIRFFLHACLLFSSENVTGIEGKLDFLQTVEEFLWLQMEKDLQQLANGLTRSLDDTVLLLHQILKNIRQTNMENDIPGATWQTMEGRRKWETEFHKSYIENVFKNFDVEIAEARDLCLTNKKENHLHNIVYENLSQENIINEETQVVMWNSPCLWKYETYASVDHFRQSLELNVSLEQREGTFLKEILNSIGIPSITHFLDIINVQEGIISRYGSVIDTVNNDLTVYDYYSDGKCTIPEEKFSNYFSSWNAFKKDILHKCNPSEELKHLFDMEITFHSPVLMLLPTKTGIGQCARFLTEHIVKLQNHLLHFCRENTKKSPEVKSVSISELTIHDLICFDDEKLLPFILANAEHKVLPGFKNKTSITYRIASIERQMLERFIYFKKLIDENTLPLFEKHHKLENECMELRESMKQVCLPSKDYQKFDRIISKAALVDICEGLRTLSLVISYLAKINCGNDLNENLLQDFITNELMLPVEEATIVGVPKLAKLQHTLAIFERLSWQRSVKNVLSGNDPFVEVLSYQENVEDVETLQNILLPLDKQQLQIEMNSLLNLNKGLAPEGRLKDYLQEHIDQKDGNSEWCAELSDNLCIKHIPHIFRISLDRN